MWRPLIWRILECYYGQVGLNQARISDLHSGCYLQSSHAKYISAEDIRYIQMDQWSVQHPAELFINSTSPTTWMFLVYPIRPHFLGHNFLSLNPSISDKKNIQTLVGDSAVTPLCCGPVLCSLPILLLHILSLHWNIKIFSSLLSPLSPPLMLRSGIGAGMIYQQ